MRRRDGPFFPSDLILSARYAFSWSEDAETGMKMRHYQSSYLLVIEKIRNSADAPSPPLRPWLLAASFSFFRLVSARMRRKFSLENNNRPPPARRGGGEKKKVSSEFFFIISFTRICSAAATRKEYTDDAFSIMKALCSPRTARWCT